MLTRLTPLLETPDLHATIFFYAEKLGFTCDSYDEAAGWASLRKDEVAIMFSLPNVHRNIPKPILSGSLYFHCDDAQALWEELKNNCEVCYPIEDLEYGMREFAVYDNNGYLLQFGQELREKK